MTFSHAQIIDALNFKILRSFLITNYSSKDAVSGFNNDPPIDSLLFRYCVGSVKKLLEGARCFRFTSGGIPASINIDTSFILRKLSHS